jgi:hypothetical protein
LFIELEKAARTTLQSHHRAHLACSAQLIICSAIVWVPITGAFLSLFFASSPSPRMNSVMRISKMSLLLNHSVGDVSFIFRDEPKPPELGKIGDGDDNIITY